MEIQKNLPNLSAGYDFEIAPILACIRHVTIHTGFEKVCLRYIFNVIYSISSEIGSTIHRKTDYGQVLQ